MSTVYRGRQADSNVDVAIKVLRQDKNIDQAAAISRFLTGAKLHKSLKHPNIARLWEFGELPIGCFSVGEILSGGNLNQRLVGGIELQGLIKIIKDIARALDYAHAVGIVHGDVKPENVLFRSSGEAVLTDFDIATHISDQVSATERGTVFGTPEYMSPEQASGRPIDGRADLYSLGVVLYRVLTGKLPYQADTAVSTGLKHVQDPIPKLPNYLAAFQEFMDRALAKKADKRFQSGEEFVQHLDMIRNGDLMPEATIRTEAISTKEITAVGGDLLTTTRDSARQERQSIRLKRKRRARRAATFCITLALLSSAAYVAYDQAWVDPERILAQLGIGEDPLLTVAWSDAQSLRQDPNQGLTAIVAAYRRVLAIHPEHAQASEEVSNLNTDWKSSIREALSQSNLQSAETRLSEGRGVFPQDLEWVQLDIELQNHLRAERIAQSTQALLRANGLSDLPSTTAVIQAFQEVLRLAPNHTIALKTLHDIAVHYAGLATTAATTGDVTAAISLLERATAADGTLTDLDGVRKLISQTTTTRAAIDDLLQQARAYRAANQLIKPAGENAAELYHRVLATDPENIFAAQGIDEVTAQIIASAGQLLLAGDLSSVELLVSQAAAAGMTDDVVNGIRQRLDTEQLRLESVANSLQMASILIEAGYLTAPSNENAVAYLREVQQIDPGNKHANALLAVCAERLAGVAKEAYEFELTDIAEQYLDLALTITPEVAEWVALRDSWEGDPD